MQTERVRVSRQAEHYLLKSQSARPDDVLYREESDNTGRRVLPLSPVGASLFNRSLVGHHPLCESAFHSRGSAQPKLLKAVERIFKRAVIDVTLEIPAIIADAENFSRNSAARNNYLFACDSKLMITCIFYRRAFFIFLRVYAWKYKSTKVHLNGAICCAIIVVRALPT